MPEPLLTFTRELWAGGNVVLSTNVEPAPADAARSVRELQTYELEYRNNLAGQSPIIDSAAAEWALLGLYRACQFLVYRELPEELVRADLGRPCPAAPSPSVCYGVDLSFRFLPEIFRLARAASTNDPLVECLMTWANQWPLSSVGISGVTPASVEPWLTDPCLRTLYVDRILATGDVSRLNDEGVKAAVRLALGAFRELSPTLYDAVQSAS